ncbi:MAG: TonB-dependent receptor [Candidatus Latescibacteria bacterium]|nr:TonB-dependent receptor [Candidatus Latescibacterota bacterium]
MSLRLLFFTICLAATITRAQEPGRISGTVSDSTSGEPLAGVVVLLADTPLGTLSNSQGRFELPRVAPGAYILQLSLVGYAPISRPVQVRAGGETALDLRLSSRPIHLGETLVQAGRLTNLVGIAASANQGVVGASDLALRPLLRPGEVVENIPGVIVTQHSGSGKANQYFMRGFNLDHGTDLAISVDGVPINMRSHAHGQGYADLNFLLPELVAGVDFRKGPYYAEVGDFGAAGAFEIRYYDRLPAGLVHLEAGQVGYARALVADNAAIGSDNLVWAGAFERNDGPWDLSEQARKLDGLLRYARGNELRGLTLSAAGYHNDWNATDQVPQRAIAAGLIDRWGYIDPTDGGTSRRYALSADWHSRSAAGTWRILAYALRYDLDLYSNFAYFLDDPEHGDQFEQRDRRWIYGAQATHSWTTMLGGRLSQTALGVGLRYDDIDNGLYHTEAQIRLHPVTVNQIGEFDAGPYLQNQTHWTGWFRTLAGLRADFFHFQVHNTFGGHSGTEVAGTLSPKLGLVFGPWCDTELYLSGGLGFHSNDARGVTAKIDPATPLPRSKGAEVGLRTALVPGLQSSLSLWLLDLKSELLWVGDAGSNEASGPTRRWGVELANFYTPAPWLTLDADCAWSHARYTDEAPEGKYVPQALAGTFDGGLAVHDLEGSLADLHGGLRLRYFGPRSLTQDNSVRSQATTLVYADLGYKVNARWTLGVNVFNLLDTEASDIDYYYTSRLPDEARSGVDDLHTHPAEPRVFRLSVSARF